MNVRQLSWMVLAALLTPCLVQTAQAQPVPKYEDLLETESKFPIDFKENWDATWKANTEAWQKDKAFMALPQRDRRLYVRYARLYEAMLQKFPLPDDQREKAVRAAAENLLNAGYRQEACQALKKHIDSSPGQFDLAVADLHMMLLRIIPWDTPAQTERGGEWIDYAATRLVALRQAGKLPKTHPAHQLALRSLVGLRRDQGRLAEAKAYLAELEQIIGPGIWTRQQQAEILVAAGRVEEPAAIYREIAGQTDDSTIQGRNNELQGYRPGDAPKFIRKMAVEVSCESLAGRDLKDQIQTIQKIILDDATAQVPMPREQPVPSVWTYVDRTLLSQEAAMLTKLRQSQQQAAVEAQKIAAAAEAHGMGLFRRYPWADAAHRGLLEYGQELLLQGRAQAAMRCFRDALTHSADPALRLKAQSGLLTALSLTDPTPELVEEALKGVDPAATFEWQGRTFKAQDIRQRLAEAAASRQPAPAAAPAFGTPVAVQNLALPAASPWAFNMLQDATCQLLAKHDGLPALAFSGTDVVVGGPSLIACYGSDLSKPRWAVQPRQRRGLWNEYLNDTQPRYYAINPTEVRPCVGDGKVISRWGHENTGRFFDALAAFDQADGRLLWSTLGEKPWQDLWPVSDPVVHEGQVYCLAMQKGLTPFMTSFLVCLDAGTGQTIWRRAIASNDPAIGGEPALDQAHYGNPVTVCDGALYLQTNAGLVARYDLRDGALEWAHVYPRGSAMRPFRAVFVNRQGAAPLMAGGAVIFLPRDVGGAFALSRETGKLLWQEPLLPADELIGRQGTVVFLRNQHSVAAVDAATGKALWERYFPEPIARSALLGGSLLVDDGKDLVHLSCKDGTAAPQPQPWKEPVLTFAPRGGGLLAVSPSAVNHDVGQPINPQAQDQPLALPLAQAWFLPRPAATIVVPPPEAQMPDRVLLVSQNLIECLTPTAKGAITWRLLVEGGFKLAWADKKLLVIHPGKVLAVGIDGKTLWQARTPFTIGRHLVAGPHLILQTNGNPWEYLGRATAAIDLTNGQVLWQSHFRQDLTYPEWSYPARGLGFDGQNLHMVGYFEPWKNCDVVVRPADGKILEIVPVPPMSAGGVAFQGTWGLIADDARRLTEIDITRKSPPKPFGADLRQVLQPGNYYMRLDHAVKMADPWALLRFDDLYYHKEDRSTVIKRGDPSYQMTIMALGDLFGDLLVASNPAGAAIVHLPTKKQIQFNMPLGPEHVGRPEKALGAWEMGSRLMLVSGMIREGRGGWPVHVRVDMLDRETGAPQGCQILDDVLMGQLLSPSTGYAVENQAVRVGQTLLVTDVAGLHAFVGSPQAPLSSLLPLPATMCLPQSIRLDGLLDDWPDTPPLAIKDRLGRPGQLQIACDGAFIYLAISYHCGQLEPREGRGAFGAGAMLEMNLQAGPLSYKANLSIDHRGKRVVENLQVEQAVDVQYGHYYDAAAGEIVFEAAVPAQALGWRAARTGIGPLQVGFTAWDGSTAIGAEPLFTVRAQMPEIEPAKAAPPKPPRRTPRRP